MARHADTIAADFVADGRVLTGRSTEDLSCRRITLRANRWDSISGILWPAVSDHSSIAAITVRDAGADLRRQLGHLQ